MKANEWDYFLEELPTDRSRRCEINEVHVEVFGFKCTEKTTTSVQDYRTMFSEMASHQSQIKAKVYANMLRQIINSHETETRGVADTGDPTARRKDLQVTKRDLLNDMANIVTRYRETRRSRK